MSGFYPVGLVCSNNSNILRPDVRAGSSAHVLAGRSSAHVLAGRGCLCVRAAPTLCGALTARVSGTGARPSTKGPPRIPSSRAWRRAGRARRPPRRVPSRARRAARGTLQ